MLPMMPIDGRLHIWAVLTFLTALYDGGIMFPMMQIDDRRHILAMLAFLTVLYDGGIMLPIIFIGLIVSIENFFCNILSEVIFIKGWGFN